MGARTRSVIVAALTGALVLTGFTPSAQADSHVVEFEGSGWGHGVGMSQWGAYGLATLGWTYDDILAHYYRGTSLDDLGNPNIWVNLEEKFTSRTLTVLNTNPDVQGVDVVITGSSGQVNAEPGNTISLAPHGTSGCVVTVNPGGQTVTDTSGCAIDMTWDGHATNPSTKIYIHGCFNTDWNASGSPQVPCQYARGELHLRRGAGGLYLSAEMPMEDYVKGISEIPYTWHAEVQKAQAVAARSFAEYQRRVRTPSTSGCWCHVRDTTSDQRYVGWGHSNRGPWVNGVNSTARRMLTHAASSRTVIKAYYSSSSGGRTEHGHVVGFASGPVEWLTSVSDARAVDGTVPNPNASWTRSRTASSIAQTLGFDAVTSVKVASTRPGSGSAATVEYKGVKNGSLVSTIKSSTWTRQNFALLSEYFSVDYTAPAGSQLSPAGDELLFYRANGDFRYNSLHSNGVVGIPILSGSNYTKNWKAIATLDLDGNGRDEMLFYRDDGLYRYYNIGSDGRVGSPIRAGDEYTRGWDSIAAVDLDGDGQDEIFFYREDGLYRYYDIRPNGSIGSPIRAGDEYTKGWDSIRAVDLDGDGQDEMFFYREDGLYRFYDIRPNASIGNPIRSGSNFDTGWSMIIPINLDGQ